MIIKKVTPDDAVQLLDIYATYVKNTAISFEYEVPSEEEFRQRIVNISAKYPYIKAMDGERIVGYAYAGAFKTRKAYDWSVETTVYVAEDVHRKGVGKELYAHLEKSLRNMGILNMNACIAMPKGKDENLTDTSFLFHKSQGFELVGTFHNSGYKFEKWYDMIWMEKMLGNHADTVKSVSFGEWEI